MTDLVERKREASDLRKAGKLEDALFLYKKSWKETGDKYDGAGLLHCLRKLKLFDEAVVFAEELLSKYSDFEWCQKEVIWTYLQGSLDRLSEEEPLVNVVNTATKIMNLNPDGLAAKMTVFKVIKSAKSHDSWDTVNEWITKVDLNSLNTKPMTDKSGREGWSDQALWYNYRIRGLIEKGDLRDAITLVDEVLERFPKQRKFLLRLKGLALHRSGDNSESEKIYQSLCSRDKADWWILYEYAKVLRASGRNDEALKLMYKAANGHSKLESMVSLFSDIGTLCKEMEKYEEARVHLVLCKYVRMGKGWSVAEFLTDIIDDLNKIIGNKNEPPSLKDALNACRSEWRKIEDSDDSAGFRKLKKGLSGKVSLGRSEQPFCFIIGKDKDSFFCHRSDLPNNITDGEDVIFDAVPSFDKKKNKESWKASNIHRKANEALDNHLKGA